MRLEVQVVLGEWVVDALVACPLDVEPGHHFLLVIGLLQTVECALVLENLVKVCLDWLLDDERVVHRAAARWVPELVNRMLKGGLVAASQV